MLPYVVVASIVTWRTMSMWAVLYICYRVLWRLIFMHSFHYFSGRGLNVEDVAGLVIPVFFTSLFRAFVTLLGHLRRFAIIGEGSVNWVIRLIEVMRILWLLMTVFAAVVLTMRHRALGTFWAGACRSASIRFLSSTMLVISAVLTVFALFMTLFSLP